MARYKTREGMPIITPLALVDGAEGVLFARIDGEMRSIAQCRNLDAIVEKIKEEYARLGTPARMNKARGTRGTGTMELYYGGAIFQDLMEKYQHDSIDTYFEIIAKNDDPTTDIGHRTIQLYGVNLDSVSVFKNDIETGAMTENVPFTFENFEYISQFDNEAESYS